MRGEKGWREGLLEERAHSLGVPSLGLVPGCLFKLILCVSVPSPPSSINPSAFKGGLQEWENVLFAWFSAWWVLSLRGEA